MRRDRKAIIVLAIIVVLAGLVLAVGLIVSARFDDGDFGACDSCGPPLRAT
jgi:hypothetical protein